MSSRKQRRGSKDGERTSREPRWKKRLYVTMPLLVLALLVVVGCSVTQPPKPDVVTPEEIAAEIIPNEGDPTPYGIPLALDNTQRLIDYYNTITLTPEQESIRRDALQPLKAPCCDDNSMYRC